MNYKDLFKFNYRNISHYNHLQIIVALLLQLLIPFIKTNSVDSSGESTRTTIYLFYYFQGDTSRLLIPYIFLILLFLALYLNFIQKEAKYFDILPLSLVPILFYTFFIGLISLSQPVALPRFEVYIEWGYMVLLSSVIAYYAIYIYLKKQKINLINHLEEREKEIKPPSSNTGTEKRWIAFLLCFSALPMAVTVPALGAFATKFMNHEELTFFTAFGIPLSKPESYFYYRFFSSLESLVNSPIFISFITFIIFASGILAIWSIMKHSTIQIVEIFFIIATLLFLLLMNTYTILFLYIFFPWFLIPFWIIYDGRKDLNLQKEGILLFTFFLAIGTILLFIQFLLPFDLELFASYPGLDQIRIRPTFIFLIFPFLLSVIHRMGKIK